MTYLDLRWPSSTSPSTSVTSVIWTDSPPSPVIVIVVSSRWNHCLAQGPMLLFFQCQLAVVLDIGWRTDMFAGLLGGDDESGMGGRMEEQRESK